MSEQIVQVVAPVVKPAKIVKAPLYTETAESMAVAAATPKNYTLERGPKGSSRYSVWTKSPKSWTNHGNIESAVYGIWTAENVKTTYATRHSAALAVIRASELEVAS